MRIWMKRGIVNIRKHFMVLHVRLSFTRLVAVSTVIPAFVEKPRDASYHVDILRINVARIPSCRVTNAGDTSAYNVGLQCGPTDILTA